MIPVIETVNPVLQYERKYQQGMSKICTQGIIIKNRDQLSREVLSTSLLAYELPPE